MNDNGELRDRIRSLLQSGRSDEIISIGEPAVPYLTAALKDEYGYVQEYVRKSAAEALVKIGKPAVPDLITALKDEYWSVRKSAAEAIGRIGVNDEQFETIVRKLKEGETWWEREGAAMTLGELKNVKAVPDLIATLKDEDWRVRWGAAEAIGKIVEKHPEYDWEAVVPYLITALKDKDLDVRKRAAEALAKIGFDKVPEEKRMEVKVLALLILEKTDDVVTIGEPTVPYLTAALKDEYSDVRYGAAWALEKIIGRLIEKGEFGEALETIRSTTTTIMNFYKGAFRTARKENKTMGKDRELLKQRIKLLEKLESLTNNVYARVKEKEGLPNPLDEKEPMEWKGAKRKDNKNQNAQKSKQTYSI